MSTFVVTLALASGAIAAQPRLSAPALSHQLSNRLADREARWLELGDRAVACPEEAGQLAELAQELWEQDYLCARDEFAQLEVTHATADDLPFIAACRLATGLVDSDERFAALSPLSGVESGELMATRAYWWAQHGYYGPGSAAEIEAAWRDLRRFFPHHNALFIRQALFVASAVRDIGEIARARSILDEALALALSPGTRLIGRDTLLQADPRAVSAAQVARLAVRRASLESGNDRAQVLADWIKRLQEIPAGLSAIQNARHIDRLRGDLLPEFDAKTLDGGNFESCALTGRITIISFGASWCGLCTAVIDEMKRLRDRFGARVNLLSVNCDSDWNTARRWAAQHEIPWSVLAGQHLSAEPMNEMFNRNGLPKTMVVDSDGRVLYDGCGEIYLDAIVERLLSRAE
jgi:thiol-disulfide isomerase/thioredoxin